MNALPILLLGGAAAAILTGKKKKKRPAPVPPVPAVTRAVGLERWGSVRTPGSMELAVGEDSHTHVGDDRLVTAVGSSNPDVISIMRDQPAGVHTSLVIFKPLKPGKSTLTIQCQDGAVLVSDAVVNA